jgi:hypothetical protein
VAVDGSSLRLSWLREIGTTACDVGDLRAHLLPASRIDRDPEMRSGQDTVIAPAQDEADGKHPMSAGLGSKSVRTKRKI